MQSIRGALLLLTVCLCASGIWTKPSFDIFKDIWADLEDGGKSIIEGLRTATQDGAAVGKDLVINRLNSKKEFFNDITNLGQSLSDALSASLSLGLSSLSKTLTESINTFTEKIASERNLVNKRAQANGLAALKELHAVALKLKSALPDINQRLGERVNEQLNEAYNEVLQWNNEQLARVDSETEGAGLEEAEVRSSLFLFYFIDDLQSVVEELEIKKSLFEQGLNDKVSTYSAYVDDLIKAMNSSSVLESLQYKRSIEKTVENLRGGREELEALLEAGRNMINRGVQDSETIASVLEKVRLSKLDFERDLDEIIERYNQSSPAPYLPQEDEDEDEDDVGSGQFLDDYSEDASDEVFFKLSESSRSLAAKLFNSTRDGIDFSKDILENMYDSQTQLLKDVTQLAKDLSVAVSEVMISGLGQLTDLLSRKILDLEKRVNQYQGPGSDSALNTGLTALRKLNSTASDLRHALTEISNSLADELSDKVNATLNELLEWKDVQLQLVDNSSNGAGVEEAAEVIGSLLQSYTDDFLEALRDLEQAKSEFEEQLLQVSLSASRKYANLLSFAMPGLLSNSKSTQHRSDILTYSGQVERRAAPLQSLLHKSRDVAQASVSASKIVARLLQQLARDKLDAEEEIARIIEKNAQQADEGSSAESDDGAPSQESENEGSSSLLGKFRPGKSIPGIFRRSKRDTGSQSETASSVISSNLIASLTESNGILDTNIKTLTEKIDALKNSTKTVPLTSGLDALKILQAAAANLSTLLEDINTQLADSPSKKVSEALAELSAWETEQLTELSKRSNARGVRQGKDTIKLVAERNERILEGTKNTFELQASQFESEVKDKISANTRNARAMIDVMTKCLEESMSLGRCSTKINQLAVSLNNSPNDLKAIRNKSKSLVKAGENAAANVDYYIEKMIADKEKCQKDIETIIRLYPTAESTSASPQEAEDDPASSDSGASNDEGEETQVGS